MFLTIKLNNYINFLFFYNLISFYYYLLDSFEFFWIFFLIFGNLNIFLTLTALSIHQFSSWKSFKYNFYSLGYCHTFGEIFINLNKHKSGQNSREHAVVGKGI